MKKLLLVLSIVLLLVSCPNEDMEETNPFVGTWENEQGKWVFTDTAITVYYTDGAIYWSGTYTYDENNITYYWDYRSPLVEEYEWPNPTIYPYFIDNNALQISIILLYKASGNN